MMYPEMVLDLAPRFAQKVPIVQPVLPGFAGLADDVRHILASGTVTKGRYLAQFEEAIAEHLNVRHAVAVSSCTTGLMLTYRALGLSGDVVVPSFTFMATVSALVWAGLHPVFADVDAGTTNLDPAAAAAAITPRTCAIVAVHNFGNPAQIEALQSIANRRGLKLIFDAAHGFGTRYQGARVGSQGDAHVYSLSPTKLVIAGEGGIVATNSDELADKVRVGREYGNDGTYNSVFAGINARMPEFNALLGLRSLSQLEVGVRRRNEIADLYRTRLCNIPGIGVQEVEPGNRSSYKDFSITIAPRTFGITRDELAARLATQNIDTRKYYDPPIHRHSAYRIYNVGAPLPKTEWLASHSLSLPIWSQMDDEIVVGICDEIARSSVRGQI